MNKREKMLAIAVGVMFVILAVAYGGKSIMDRFTLVKTQISSVSKQKREQDLKLKAGSIANERLLELEQRALPGDMDVARNLYKTWLLDLVDRSGMQSPNVNAVAGRNNKDIYFVHTFNVTCRGDIQKLTNFLYDFYSVDFLHRFKSIGIKPIRERKDLTLTFTVEVLALPTAPNRAKLESGPANRLVFKELEPYHQSIVERNIFSPKNNAPRLDVRGSYEVAMGESLEISPRASDAEKDKLSFYADLEELPGARIDRDTGKVRWRPSEMGEVIFTLYVKDNNLPSRTSSREIRVNVVEAKQRVVVEKPRGFDTSKLAFLTGITTSEGRAQIWLSLRNEGKVLKLAEGDSYAVGYSEGKVGRISRRQVELVAKDGRKLVLMLGRPLAEAQERPSGE